MFALSLQRVTLSRWIVRLLAPSWTAGVVVLTTFAQVPPDLNPPLPRVVVKVVPRAGNQLSSSYPNPTYPPAVAPTPPPAQEAIAAPAFSDLMATYPPKIETKITQTPNTQVQTAINPASRVHTQVRLEFLQGLFEPEVTNDKLDAACEQKLQGLEHQLYGRHYNEQRLGKRLNRVENSLWANNPPVSQQQKPLAERWQGIIHAAGVKNIATSPTADDNLLMTVRYMEQRLSPMSDHSQTPLLERVSNLETALYGQPVLQGTLQQRVASLSEKFPVNAAGVQVQSDTGHVASTESQTQQTAAPVELHILPIQQETSVPPPTYTLVQPIKTFSKPVSSVVQTTPAIMPAFTPGDIKLRVKLQPGAQRITQRDLDAINARQPLQRTSSPNTDAVPHMPQPPRPWAVAP